MNTNSSPYSKSTTPPGSGPGSGPGSAPTSSKLGVWLFAIFGSIAGLGVLAGGVYWLVTAELEGFQHKSYQSEAKITLSSLYTAQMLTKAEHDFYSSDLQHGDMAPQSLRYSYGYVQASAASEQTQALGIDPQRHFQISEKGAGDDATEAEALLERMRQICPDCVVSESGFKAFAFANLDGDPEWDVWTIDQDKNLQHLRNDLDDL
ncbi:MAG TPA: hypothetical protein PLZ57_07030 [Pseudobdellovibrionaceae bacterium]|nr:hypothetical protein [Pseudobdellovibrionaceae bacterium]